MSSNNVAEDESVATQRPRRTIKLSRRAEALIEAGESVPGLHSEGLISPRIEDEESSPLPVMVSKVVQEREKTAAHKVSQMNDPAARVRDQNIAEKAFAPGLFTIYDWQYPQPKSFTDLPESRKAWKRKIDEKEKAADIDDGADDWDNFDGDIDKYCVASAFLKRAKRAFWAGKTWEDFEEQERNINSEGDGNSTIAPEEQLSNKFRLQVFDALKRRLCEEIWLEPYRDPPGLVRLPLRRKDSRMPSVSSVGQRSIIPDMGGKAMTPTPEEAARGIVAWSLNSGGTWEPRYGDEKKVGSGMEDLRRYWRDQEPKSMRGRPRRTEGPAASTSGGAGAV